MNNKHPTPLTFADIDRAQRSARRSGGGARIAWGVAMIVLGAFIAVGPIVLGPFSGSFWVNLLVGVAGLAAAIALVVVGIVLIVRKPR